LERVAGQRASSIQQSDEQAFTSLLAPLIQPGYRLACALLHDSSLAEDVVQEASLIAWRKIRRLDDQSKARAWFLGIVSNECRNARRRRWWRVVTLGLPSTISVASSEEKWVTDADVRMALGRLSHDDRLVVSLYFYLDMPLDEVAGVLGTTVDAARKRLYRAVHRMRPDLDLKEALK
jgi:RNA polymerase sigma factor (sigma-70 family)